MATKKPKHPVNIGDLKGADYNPRTISPRQLKQLEQSIAKFGGLESITFNVRSGVLVSGHQRVKTMEGKKTKLVITERYKAPDAQGTVGVGYIAVKEPTGAVTRHTYREVDWSDRATEMAANVAANAAGGEFDQAKLGAIMAELEQAEFDIELTSMDSWSTAKAIGNFKRTLDGEDADNDSSAGIQVIDPGAMSFDHCCPKCGFQWNSNASVKSKAKPKTEAPGKINVKKRSKR